MNNNSTLQLEKQSIGFIKTDHRDEWVSSKAHPEIIDLNVRSLSGDNAYESLLYALDKDSRRNDGRLRDKYLKGYAHLDYGGWWCSGLNLATFTNNHLVSQTYAADSEWGCFKPDRPRVREGKSIKYETPPNAPTGIFALQIGEELWKGFTAKYSTLTPNEPAIAVPPAIEFWQWAIDHAEIPVTITEGAKKAGCLLSHKHVAIALSGVYNFTDENGDLKPEIKALCRPGREFVIAFDRDNRWEVRDNVARAMRKLAGLLEREDCIVSVLHWEIEQGKGIDDFVAKKGHGELEELYDERIDFEDFWEKHARPRELRMEGLAKLLRTQLKGRIAWNELLSRVELDGEQLELNGELCFRFLYDFNVVVPERTLINGLLYEAKQNSYHPVRRYLDSVSHLESIDIDNLSDRYFGTSDPLYNAFLKKWLLGAVARVYEPGCKFDEALILQGKEWAGKSTFFKTIGGRWFDDSFGSNIESAKSLMVLHKSWIQEWAEFDRVSSKQDFNVIKGFLSRQTDCFVRQYGRDAIDHPRSSVMCGSINPATFLRDATGDRRFWVIPIPQEWKVPIAEIAEERDRLWASIVQAYRRGDSRFLTADEYERATQSNEQFRDSDEWESVIANYLESREIRRFSIYRLLTDALGFTLDKLETRAQNRVKDCLMRLKCKSLGSRHETEFDGLARRLWERPVIEKTDTQVPSPEIYNASTTPYNASATPPTTVYKCTPLYAETPIEQDLQRGYNAYNAKNEEKLFPLSGEEKNPPPPIDIHAKIDQEMIRLGMDKDNERAWYEVHLDKTCRSELTEEELIAFHHLLTTWRSPMENGKNGKRKR